MLETGRIKHHISRSGYLSRWHIQATDALLELLERSNFIPLLFFLRDVPVVDFLVHS